MIFLSYASEDFERVDKLADKLELDGFGVWMDKRNILAGQEWEPQIWRAATKADFFCIMLSKHSVSKRGFIRKEIRFALDKWKEKLPEDVYLIPCRIDPVDPPYDLQHLNYVNLFEEPGYSRLRKALRAASKEDQVELGDRHAICGVDERLELDLEWHGFSSPDLAKLDAEIGTYMRRLARRREEEEWPLPSSVEMRSYVYSRATVSLLSAGAVSVALFTDTYFSGAAHNSYAVDSLNFDRTRQKLFGARDIFANEHEALTRISAATQFELNRQRVLNAWPLDQLMNADEWIAEGAGPKWENFDVMVLGVSGIEFRFSPYRVGPFAWGLRSVHFNWDEVSPLLNEHFLALLAPH